VLLFTLSISLATGLGFGVAPALFGRRSFAASLHQGTRASAGRGSRRLRAALLLAQVSIAGTLLIGAGLMLRSLHGLSRVDPGYDPEQVLTMTISLPFSRYADGAARLAFYDELLARLEGHPGVVSAAATMSVPLDGSGPMTTELEIENRPREANAPRPLADLRAVTPGYFRLLGIPLLRGRLFDERDARGAPPVAIVNQAMARRYWTSVGEDPIGQRVAGDGAEGGVTIVGVVGDVKQYGLAEEAAEELYRPFAQAPFGSQLLVRTTAAPLRLAGDVRDLVRAIDPDQPVARVQTLEQYRLDSLGRERLIAVLLSLFAALALAVTAAGVAGLVAFSVSQRTREIGVRRALGARSGSLLRLVLRQGMAPVAAGLVLGLAAAAALSRLLADLLFGVTATDPWTYGTVAAVLLLVAAVACLVPARRAAAIDPLVALRSE